MATDDGMFPDDDETDIVCKRCGQDGFHWEQMESGQWRLFDLNGLHQCTKRKVNNSRP